jgi:hypothetical protein
VPEAVDGVGGAERPVNGHGGGKGGSHRGGSHVPLPNTLRASPLSWQR